MPLEQYDDQLSSPLWQKLHWSLYPQFEDRLWYKLKSELPCELLKESLVGTLKRELERQCR